MPNDVVVTDVPLAAILEQLRDAIVQAPTHKAMQRVRERLYKAETELAAHLIVFKKLQRQINDLSFKLSSFDDMQAQIDTLWQRSFFPRRKKKKRKPALDLRTMVKSKPRPKKKLRKRARR